MKPKLSEGQTLGKYRIIETLGRGGMAQVYKAYHSQLDRYVAIKILRSDLVEEQEFLARFQREARSVAALRHPNIVQIYDFDVQDELYYMVMELLEGDTLKAHLSSYRSRGARIAWGDVVRIMLDTLDGLAYAHNEGIVHRDIKPANILLTRHGQAVVTDFGIAQIIGGTQYTISGALMGTLNYMAPEQGLEGRGDTRSDLYSLGIVYFEMLTGQIPFDADTPLAILMKHLNDPLPLPHKLDPSIPEPLERVALKVLSKQPEDRYQTAAEMAQGLQAAALEAGVEIPKTISLAPVVRTAPEAVAVFSGTEREHIPDKQFASGDTDSNLSARLQGAAVASAGIAAAGVAAAGTGAAIASAGAAVLPGNAQPGAAQVPAIQPDAAGARTQFDAEKAVTAAGESLRTFGQRLKPMGKSLKGFFTPPDPIPDSPIQRVVPAVIIPALLLIFSNTCMATIGGMADIPIFERGWPIELALAGMLLSALMASTANPWLLLPAGIVLGNGFIMGYYSVTGWWWQWVLLWPLEPLLVFGCIVGTLWMARQERQYGRWLARRSGILMTASAAFLYLVILSLSALLGTIFRY